MKATIHPVFGRGQQQPKWLRDLALRLAGGGPVVWVNPGRFRGRAVEMLSQLPVQAFVEVDHVDRQAQ